MANILRNIGKKKNTEFILFYLLKKGRLFGDVFFVYQKIMVLTLHLLKKVAI
jgi:hypothetical protein